MQKWVLPLTAGLLPEQVGRKAAGLSRLIAAGFPVPPGVCVTTQAYRSAAQSRDQMDLPDGLLEEITAGLPAGAPLAVRSSAEVEDLPGASLAGRYATFLNVNGPEALRQAVLGCWEKFRSLNGSRHHSGTAVLVQPLIQGECAGVCFTVDPVRQQAALLLVVSAWGQGAGVVEGSIPTDTARLRRVNLTIESFSTAEKHTALRPAPSGKGLAAAPVDEALRSAACLPESWLERVGQFGLAIEQLFGAPQDVEWAIAEGRLWILQSRPVTALAGDTIAAARFPVHWSNEEEPRHFWWLSSDTERPGAALLPAEIELSKLRTEGGEDAVHYGGGEMTRWFRFFNGRQYMAVARSANRPGRVRVMGAARQDLTERMARENITHWETWGPEIELATARLAAFDPNSGAQAVDGPALAEHLEDAMATAARHWMIHTLTPRQIRDARLLEAYMQMTGKPREEAAPDIPFLLAGAETVQTRLVEALYDLACMAVETQGAARAIEAWRESGFLLDEIGFQALTAGAPGFAVAFRDLMRTYGGRLCFRSVPGFPPALPFPWREAPEYAWELIAAYIPLAREDRRGSPRAHREAALREMQRRVDALCAGASDPARIEPFLQALLYARRNAAFLDEHNHHIDQLSMGQCIQALFYAGRWLAGQARLQHPLDVLWLTLDEVLGALRGAATVPLDATAASRRAEFAAWQALTPPACLGLPDPSLPERPAAAPAALKAGASPAPAPTNTLTGQPCSLGSAAGRARVITGDALGVELAAGDVLVTADVKLAWIPVLPALAAVVLDYGSPGDHSAITAREFGLPMVCSTLHATRCIPDGARVIVDAHNGVVTWE